MSKLVTLGKIFSDFPGTAEVELDTFVEITIAITSPGSGETLSGVEYELAFFFLPNPFLALAQANILSTRTKAEQQARVEAWLYSDSGAEAVQAELDESQTLTLRRTSPPLVGMHFHPPAKQVLAHLPSGASLILAPEPENSYDELAIRVLVAFASIPPERHEALQAELDGVGMLVEDLAGGEARVWLGYVARTSVKCPVGNQAVFDACPAEQVPGLEASLGFDMTGKPLALISLPE